MHRWAHRLRANPVGCRGLRLARRRTRRGMARYRTIADMASPFLFCPPRDLATSTVRLILDLRGRPSYLCSISASSQNTTGREASCSSSWPRTGVPRPPTIVLGLTRSWISRCTWAIASSRTRPIAKSSRSPSTSSPEQIRPTCGWSAPAAIAAGPFRSTPRRRRRCRSAGPRRGGEPLHLVKGQTPEITARGSPARRSDEFRRLDQSTGSIDPGRGHPRPRTYSEWAPFWPSSQIESFATFINGSRSMSRHRRPSTKTGRIRR
jgi:hypothetical protein